LTNGDFATGQLDSWTATRETGTNFDPAPSVTMFDVTGSGAQDAAFWGAHIADPTSGVKSSLAGILQNFNITTSRTYNVSADLAIQITSKWNPNDAANPDQQPTLTKYLLLVDGRAFYEADVNGPHNAGDVLRFGFSGAVTPGLATGNHTVSLINETNSIVSGTLGYWTDVHMSLATAEPVVVPEPGPIVVAAVGSGAVIV
jgi:hypothetical protein